MHLLRFILIICLSISLSAGLGACTSLFDRQRALSDADPEVARILTPLSPYWTPSVDVSYTQALAISPLIEDARTALNAFFLRTQNACYDNFFVNSCLTPAQQEQRYWLLRVRQLEIRVSSIKRQESNTLTSQAIATRLAEKPLPEEARGLGNIFPDQKTLDQSQKERFAQEQQEKENEAKFQRKQQQALDKKKSLKP